MMGFPRAGHIYHDRMNHHTTGSDNCDVLVNLCLDN